MSNPTTTVFTALALTAMWVALQPHRAPTTAFQDAQFGQGNFNGNGNVGSFNGNGNSGNFNGNGNR